MNRISSVSLVCCFAASSYSLHASAQAAAPAEAAVAVAAQPTVAVAPTVAAAPAVETLPIAVGAPDVTAKEAPTIGPDWLPPALPDKALVIIFRESNFVGSAINMKVLADEGVKLPPIPNGLVVHVYFEPGDHTLYSDKKRKRDARIVGMEAGKIYFFEGRWEYNMARRADVDLVPVEYAEAVRRVSRFKRPRPVTF